MLKNSYREDTDDLPEIHDEADDKVCKEIAFHLLKHLINLYMCENFLIG